MLKHIISNLPALNPWQFQPSGLVPAFAAPMQARPAPIIYLNVGGPSSRTRKEHIGSSILGIKGDICCPIILQLGLDFEGQDPVTVMQRILKKKGLSLPEELKPLYCKTTSGYICRTNAEIVGVRVSRVPDSKVLKQALMLGLCTPYLFDPARPVIWTQESLTRRLELFDAGNFYK
jgi:hypothetical protein